MAISRTVKFLGLEALALLAGLVVMLAQSFGAGLAAFVLANACLRVYSLVRSCVWLVRRGGAYQSRINCLLEEVPDWEANSFSLLQIYREAPIRGDFFPFGIRAVTLDVWRQDSRSSTRFLATAAYKLWKYYFFVPVVALVSYTAILLPSRYVDSVAFLLLYLAGTVLCIGALVIAGEATLSFFTFGSWSLAYHRFDIDTRRGTTEFSVLAGGVFTAVLAGALTISIAARGLGAFALLSGERFWSTFGLGFYYTLNAFTGNGDPQPRAWAGYLIIALLYVEASAYLLVVISLLLESLSREPKLALARSHERLDGETPAVQVNLDSATSEALGRVEAELAALRDDVRSATEMIELSRRRVSLGDLLRRIL